MERRSFLKIGLSFVAVNLLTNNLLNANSTKSDNIIIHLFCYGGADFRYMFAPTEENSKLRELYFNKQPDIVSVEDYKDKVIDGKNYQIKKEKITGLENLIDNNEIAIIPNVWFSDNRDHQHSIARNLLGDNDMYQKSTSELDGWLGRVAGNLNKNAITVSNEWDFAARTNNFENSETINFNKTRPFGISDSENAVNKALQRYYNSETSTNPIVNNLINMEKTIKSLSNKINDRLNGTNKISNNIGEWYLKNQVTNLFDAIDTRDIINSNYFYIDNPGWDFHGYYKNAANIKIPAMFDTDGALDVIQKELKKRNLWDKTTLIISSEFGRQLTQNGIKGKDHGHGNLMFVAGGNINGGIYGDIFNDSEIPLWKDGYDLPGKTIFPSFNTNQIEQEFELYKG
jgi:uncharacterized protein (DUF1501 family)